MRALLYLPMAFLCPPLAMLAGCSGEPVPDGNQVANVAEPALPDMPPDLPMPGPQPDADIAGISADPHEHPVTPAQTMAEEPGPAVAAAVAQRYFNRIAAGKAGAAWELWDDEGRASGMSQRAFAESFSRYAEYRASLGPPGPMEAGAGQRHVTLPVEITGTLRDGTPIAMGGSVTLHRTGVIDGATAEQRQWRISSADLQPRPVAPPTPAPTAATDAAPDAVDSADPEDLDVPAGTETTVTARYACVDGTRLIALFDNAAGTVTLRRGTLTLSVLRQQPAGSGIRYAGNGTELRGKGDEAMITLPGQSPLACTARA